MNDTPHTPLVSVIMPAYNARPFIEEAIHSILQQEYSPYEVIVVDDGSIDGTAEFAATLDGRVRVIRQKNAGPAAARNLAIAHARGEYIAFLDADDVWLAGKLRTQISYLLSHPGVAIVAGRFCFWDGATGNAPKAELHPEVARTGLVANPNGVYIYPSILLDSAVHIITSVVRKQVFEVVGRFDESLRTGEDYDFWIRASQHFKFHMVSETVAWYRIHGSGTTMTPRNQNNEYLVVIRSLERYGAFGRQQCPLSAASVKRRLFQLSFDHGYMHVRKGNAAVARASLVRSLRYNKTSLRAWFYCAVAVVLTLFSRKPIDQG